MKLGERMSQTAVEPDSAFNVTVFTASAINPESPDLESKRAKKQEARSVFRARCETLGEDLLGTIAFLKLEKASEDTLQRGYDRLRNIITQLHNLADETTLQP
jgi:hypothetical protein